jgi:hypothetical protein
LGQDEQLGPKSTGALIEAAGFAKTLNFLSSSPLSHFGQLGVSLVLTNASKSLPQPRQLYS